MQVQVQVQVQVHTSSVGYLATVVSAAPDTGRRRGLTVLYSSRPVTWTRASLGPAGVLLLFFFFSYQVMPSLGAKYPQVDYLLELL